MMELQTHRIEALCAELKLTSLGAQYAALAQAAADRGTPYADFLEDALRAEREARRARERAEKRFQTVTKETDWRVAKAYVALAEDTEDDPSGKEDASKKRTLETSTEGRATDQYLDDAEWEAQERREGRGSEELTRHCPFRFVEEARRLPGPGTYACMRGLGCTGGTTLRSEGSLDGGLRLRNVFSVSQPSKELHPGPTSL